jgi:hypothetical protein
MDSLEARIKIEALSAEFSTMLKKIEARFSAVEQARAEEARNACLVDEVRIQKLCSEMLDRMILRTCLD